MTPEVCGEPVALYDVPYGEQYDPCAKPKGHAGSHDPSVTPPQPPRTEAGRRLLEFWRLHRSLTHGVNEQNDAIADDILAIEAEAAGAERERLAQLVEKGQWDDVFRPSLDAAFAEGRGAALAALRAQVEALAFYPEGSEAGVTVPMGTSARIREYRAAVLALLSGAAPAAGEPEPMDWRRWNGRTMSGAEAADFFGRKRPLESAPAAPAAPALDVERLAVVGAARRFLAAHDRVISSAVVSRDDTFAMKNRADELRDVLAFYDEAADEDRK